MHTSFYYVDILPYPNQIIEDFYIVIVDTENYS